MPAAAVSPTGTAAAQEQLLRMQEAWRESVEKDVICLREVLGQYKEQVERLEMQKTLLLSQVCRASPFLLACVCLSVLHRSA